MTGLRRQWGNPPAWVPAIDDALDAGLRLTSAKIHERLLEDDSDEEDALDAGPEASAATPEAPPARNPPVRVLSVPGLFSRIGFAFEAVERQGAGIQRAFIDPTGQSREELIGNIVSRAMEPFAALERLFGITDNVERADLKLAVASLGPEEEAQKVGEIEDLTIATCIAWAGNVETSTDAAADSRIGFWLCDSSDKQISKKIALEVTNDEGAVRFNLDLSAMIGRSELNKMSEAMENLAKYSKTE